MRELVVEPLVLESTFFFPDEAITYRSCGSHRCRSGGNVDPVGLAWMLRRIGDVDFMLHGGGTNGQIWLRVGGRLHRRT